MNNLVKCVYTFKVSIREEKITGFVLSSKDDWICLHLNNVDLTFDGILYFPKNIIEDVFRGENEKFLNKIYLARSFSIPKEYYNFDLTLSNILSFSMKKNEIIQIETDEEGVCYIGKLKSIKDDGITIRTITSSAKLDKLDVYDFNEIRFVELKNDYIKSLESILS